MNNGNKFRWIKNGIVFILVILMVLTQVPTSFATLAGAPAEAGSETSGSENENPGLSAGMSNEDPAGIEDPSEETPAPEEPLVYYTVSFELPEGASFVFPNASENPSKFWAIPVASGEKIPLDMIPLISEVPDGKEFLGWLPGTGTAPVDSEYISSLTVTGNLTFTAAFGDAPAEITPFGMPAAGAFDINKSLGGGTVDSSPTAIHIYGEGVEQIFAPSADNNDARTAALKAAVDWLAANGADKDYVMYIPSKGTTETAWPVTSAINFAGLTTVGTLVITGVALDPVVGTSGVPEPATANTQAGYSRLTENTDFSFGCNVILRNIRYMPNNIYMNGHNLTLGHKSWAGANTNYYGGAKSGNVSGNPSITVWSTSDSSLKTTFVGGNYTGTLTGNASITINNTSGNRIEVWGAGYGTGTSNTANLNGSATTTIKGMATSRGGLGYFAGGVQYGDVTGTITNTISGPGRFNSGGVLYSYDWNTGYSLLLGGSRKGDIGQDAYKPSKDGSGKPISGTGTNVITNNIDTSAWSTGRAHFIGVNFASGTVKGNIVNTVKTSKKDDGGSIISFSGGAGRNAYSAVNGESQTSSSWLDVWDVKANSTSLTVGNVDAAVQAAKNAMRFELYGNITNTIKSGVIYGSIWDWDRHMRGAGYGFVEGNVISRVGTEGPAGGENAFSRPAYSTTDPTIGEDSNVEFSGGGGWPTEPQSSMIIGDTELYLDNVWGDWVYGGSYAGCQIGDTLAVLNDGIVDTLEGAGRDYRVHIGDSRAEVRGGQVDWFLSGVGYNDHYNVGNTSVEIYEAPRNGNQIMPIINASVGGMYGMNEGGHGNYVSGDSTLTIHGGDFSGIARYTPYQGLSTAASNYGYIFGNATTTVDVRGNTQGIKVESRSSTYPNRISGGLRYDNGNNTYLGASAANTITLNVFADKTTGSLLKGMNLYGDGAGNSYAGNTRSGTIFMNINAPGADIGELFATKYPNINNNVLRKNVVINLVSAKSLEGISATATGDNVTNTVAAESLKNNKQAILNVGPQAGVPGLEELEVVPAADGFAPRINVTKSGIRNFTSMNIVDRLLIAQTGNILNGGGASDTNHAGTYNKFAAIADELDVGEGNLIPQTGGHDIAGALDREFAGDEVGVCGLHSEAGSVGEVDIAEVVIGAGVVGIARATAV
ncbi:hypothetical protein AGMMS49983_11220 [Clostridia bacterium]|nr:hypothetical protein AGMMS49983_11220 [Clostridia bacterium]